MPILEQIIRDRDFIALPIGEKLKVLDQIDPDFSNLPDLEKSKVISRLPSASWEQDYPDMPHPEAAWKQDRPISQAISKVARPVLELGGLTAGAIVGAPVAPPYGGITGGALGYGMGANVANKLDEFLELVKPTNLKEVSMETISNVGKGAMYGMGGAVGSKVLTLAGEGIWTIAQKMGLLGLFKRIKDSFPTLSDKGILLKAQAELNKIRELTPEAEKTIIKTEELIKRAGIKTEPTFAQKTGGQKAAVFEQSAAAKDREIAEILKGKDAQINQEALSAIEKQFPGKTGITDIISGVESRSAILKAEAERTAQIATEKITPLSLVKRPQVVGQEIKASLELAKETEKEAIKKIYAEIPPDININAEPLNAGIKKLFADYEKIGGGSRSLPSDITKQISKRLKETEGKTVTFDSLRDWRSQIGEESRAAITGIEPNLKLFRRLKMLENGIDETMDQLLKLGPEQASIKAAYSEASQRFARYATMFRKGTVGDVLQSGQLAEGGKVAISDIPGRFFRTGKMDVADDLIRAIGKDNAGKLIDDYAVNDLLARAGGAEGTLKLGIAYKWLGMNKDVLNKYGLYNKFNEIIKTNQVSEQALTKFNEYNKGIASKIIGVDVDDVIKNVFSGASRARSAVTANNLLNLPGIKENPAAIEGVKNSFKDFLLRQMETSAVDVVGNPVRSLAKAKGVLNEYLPAMRVLYKDAPEKITALLDYHKVLEMLARNKAISFAGGSATAEKFTGTEAMKLIGKNLAQYTAVSMGAGWKFSVLKNLWAATFGAPGKFTREKVSALLTEAIHNPDIAKTIMEATKKLDKNQIQIVQKKFSNHLITMGLYAGLEGEE